MSEMEHKRQYMWGQESWASWARRSAWACFSS